MNLINQLFFASFISSVTSSLLVLVWRMLRNFFVVVNAKIAYITLRWICLMFLFQFGYIAVLLTYRKWFQGQSEVWKLVFAYSSKLTAPLGIIAAAWFLASGGLLSYYAAECYLWHKKLADNIPEDDPQVNRVFRRVCEKMNIRAGRVELIRNVTLDMPLISGWLRPQVLLPENDYTEEELELIFFHELSHHKHGDVKYKTLGMIITLIHCFNPAAYYVFRRLNRWSEFMADVSALEKMGCLYHSKAYYDSIMRLIPDGKNSTSKCPFISALKKDDNMFSRRVDFMRSYHKVQAAGKIVTAVMTLAFMFTSSTTAYASAKMAADVHNVVYQTLEEQTDIDSIGLQPGVSYVTDDGIVLHYARIEDLNMEGMQEVSAPDQDMVSFAAGVYYNIDWYVNPNTRYVSGEFRVSKGQTMRTVASVTPGEKTYRLGIMDDDGNAWYIERNGASSYNFPVATTNNYRVFVQNNYRDTTVLHAKGNFIYEN